jgi:hypothetical protein
MEVFQGVHDRGGALAAEPTRGAQVPAAAWAQLSGMEIHVSGPLDPHLGWVMDFAEIKAAFKAIEDGSTTAA